MTKHLTSPATASAHRRYRVYLTEKLHYTVDLLAEDEDEARDMALETEHRSETECTFFDAEEIAVIPEGDKNFSPCNACETCGIRNDDGGYRHCPACIEKIKARKEQAVAHTPGPWETWHDEDRTDWIVQQAEGRFAVCRLMPRNAAADARLIAAAPELLDACRQVLALFHQEIAGDESMSAADFLDDFLNTRPIVAAAVARAEEDAGERGAHGDDRGRERQQRSPERP